MSEQSEDRLAGQLAELTRWTGDTGDPWRSALERARGAGERSAWLRRLTRLRVPSAVAACVLLAPVGVMVAILLTGRLQSLRASDATSVSERSVAASSARGAAPASQSYSESMRALGTLGYVEADGLGYSGGEDEQSAPVDLRGGHGSFDDRSGRYAPPQPDAPYESTDLTLVPRQVVRKAVIELACKDVRAAFLNVGHRVSEARGEFTQESSLSGEAERATANLTLRVAADRLDTLLGELRKLGTIVSERSSGQDVTTQAVDLEARLRNEQRVEAELLDLLQNRADAPLGDILTLRGHISRVRGEIERLSAQRERLGRLVSLATVLVILRAKEAPRVEPSEPGLAAYFRAAMSGAWNEGCRLLADTAAWLMSVFVGGLIWWAALVVAAIVLRRWLARRAANS